MFYCRFNTWDFKLENATAITRVRAMVDEDIWSDIVPAVIRHRGSPQSVEKFHACAGTKKQHTQVT